MLQLYCDCISIKAIDLSCGIRPRMKYCVNFAVQHVLHRAIQVVLSCSRDFEVQWLINNRDRFSFSISFFSMNSLPGMIVGFIEFRADWLREPIPNSVCFDTIRNSIFFHAVSIKTIFWLKFVPYASNARVCNDCIDKCVSAFFRLVYSMEENTQIS